MEKLTSIEQFTPRYSLTQVMINKILFQLGELTGIKSMDVTNDRVTVEYNIYKLTPEIIKDTLIKGGFPFNTISREPGIFKKFITKMGRDNMEAYGGKPPKCCGNP